jgi:hypothetical protein
MRPFTVLIGILAGSAASITLGLAMTLMVYGVVEARHPELTQEVPDLPRLVLNLIVFAGLTAVSSGSLFGQLRGRSWRGWAHAATAGCLLLLLLWFWPRKP